MVRRHPRCRPGSRAAHSRVSPLSHAATASFAGAFLTTWPAMGGSALGVNTFNLVALVET